MPPRLLFVGERPSPKAAAIGATWENGRMAARTLHAALDAAGVPAEARSFVNLWTVPGIGRPQQQPSRAAVRVVRAAAAQGVRVVALGHLVAEQLERRRIPFLQMVHPAARGRIRKRERYIEHVRQVLAQP